MLRQIEITTTESYVLQTWIEYSLRNYLSEIHTECSDNDTPQPIEQLESILDKLRKSS